MFEGELSIVEEQWSIHSLDLKTSHLGITFHMNQIYNPIENKAWLPVSHIFKVGGTFFGIKFEYNYLATVSNYQIELNEDLEVDLVIIDEKVEKELAAKLEEENKNVDAETFKKIASGKKVTRKKMRKLMRAYVKLEEKKDTISNVEYSNYIVVDSLAYKKDFAFWNKKRPVPLSAHEIRGYHRMDSMARVLKREKEGDTIKTKKGKEGFQVYDIIQGSTYKVR